MINRNAYRWCAGSVAVLVLLIGPRLFGQELPTPLSRPADEEPPPAAVLHELFVKGIEANRDLFDRTFCEGEYEIHSPGRGEPMEGRFRCWQYFHEGEGPRPSRRCLRLETEGDQSGVWVVGPDSVQTVHDSVMVISSYNPGDAMRPSGPNMPPPPLLLMAPPGGFGAVTYHQSLGNPTIERSQSREGDVQTLVQEQHRSRGTESTRWGDRQTCRFQIEDDRWLPISCEEVLLRGGKIAASPPGRRVYCEMTYADGRPARLETSVDPFEARGVYRFDRWEKMDQWNEELFAQVMRDGWEDPRRDGLVLYEYSSIELDNGSQAPVWQLSEWKDGEFHPLCQQWVTMTQIWRPQQRGIEAGVQDFLGTLLPDKPERLVFCESGPAHSDNQDLQDFLTAVREALDQREVPHEQGNRRAFQSLRRLHRMTYSVRECYDGSLLQWRLFAPGAVRSTATAGVWIPHPGQVPEGGEVTSKGPPGASADVGPIYGNENYRLQPQKEVMERKLPGQPVNPGGG